MIIKAFVPAPRHRLKTVAIGLMALLTMGASGPSMAQTFPNKPVTMIVAVSSPAGDALVRLLAETMTKRTGTSIIVDPKASGQGVTGLNLTARAQPDGHTVGLVFTGSFIVTPMMSAGVAYHPIKDFDAVTRTWGFNIGFVASPAIPVKSFGELIAMAKAKPGSLRVGYPGATNKIALALIRSQTGAQFLEVPYGTTPQLQAALLGGDVDMVMGAIGSYVPLIKAGKAWPLAVGAIKRESSYPDVPTVAETVPDFELASWTGAVVPAGTPRDRIGWLNREILAVTTAPQFRERILNAALNPYADTPEEFGAAIRKIFSVYEKVVKQYNITD